MVELLNDSVRVYLQGRNALLPFEVKEESITYWIGSEITKLQVKDFRITPLCEALRILKGESEYKFAEVFNRPARAIVKSNDNDLLEIELHEYIKNGNEGQDNEMLLWLGVLEDNMMPNINSEWEFLRSCKPYGTAIAVLIAE